jgi:lysophospholipase L1-like esterase
MGLGYLNLGISGTYWTNRNNLANNGYTRFTSQIISKPFSDYIVFQYGSNEFGSTPVAMYAEQLEEKISEAIFAGYLPERICLCSIPFVADNAYESLLNTFRDAIEDVVATYGTKYFDLLQWMRDNGGNALLSDAVHLNQTGQDGWRDGVYAAFIS